MEGNIGNFGARAKPAQLGRLAQVSSTGQVSVRVMPGIAAMRTSGGLHISGRNRDFVPLDLVTTDLVAAIAGAKVILVSTYGTVHPQLAAAMASETLAGLT